MLATDVKAKMDAAMYQQLAMAGTLTGRFSGKRDNLTMIDDVYRDPDKDYDQAMTQIEIATQHIQRSVQAMEHLRDLRFRSPWHPKRTIRWFQKRSRKFWLWALCMPVLLPIYYAITAKVFVDFGWLSGFITGYALIAGTGVCMKYLK